MPRWIQVVLGAAALSLFASAPATASVTVFYDADALTVVDNDAYANQITIDVTTTQFVVGEDGTDGVSPLTINAGAGCSGGGTLPVTCTRDNDASTAPFVEVSMTGGHPDDVLQRVTLDDAQAIPVESRMFGGDGGDFLEGGGGADYLIGQGGSDVLDGFDGSDRFSGGPGGDTIRDTSSQETIDRAEYFSTPGQPDEFRSTGVTVSLDNVRNDGSEQDTLNPGDGGFKDDVRDSVTAVSGSEYGDTIVGSALPNRLSGFGGPDDITGGGGYDEVHGHAQFDTLRMRDGGRRQGRLQQLRLLPRTPRRTWRSSTEAASTRSSTARPSTRARSRVTAGRPEAAAPPAAATRPAAAGRPATARRRRAHARRAPGEDAGRALPGQDGEVPELHPRDELCGAKRWCRLAEVKSRLRRLKLNYELQEREATKKTLEAAVDRTVAVGEVLKHRPEEERADHVGAGPADAHPRLHVLAQGHRELQPRAAVRADRAGRSTASSTTSRT